MWIILLPMWYLSSQTQALVILANVSADYIFIEWCLTDTVDTSFLDQPWAESFTIKGLVSLEIYFKSIWSKQYIRAFRTHVQRIDWSSRSVEKETETFGLKDRTRNAWIVTIMNLKEINKGPGCLNTNSTIVHWRSYLQILTYSKLSTRWD